MDCKWFAINKTVQGASHKRSGTVCQDHGLVCFEKAGRLPLISVVADGHGSKKHMRSDVGSSIACNVALDITKRYCNNFFSSGDFNLIKDVCCQNFKKDVICAWIDDVLAHAANNAFSDRELSLLSISRDDDSIMVLSKIIRAYGSTLLILVITESFILSWQLGDGDIIFYFNDSRIFSPISKNLQYIANETSSLCSDTAFYDMKFNIHYLFNNEDIPDLIMMSTDGYSNSFNSIEDFYKAPADFYDLLVRNSASDVEYSLAQWLNETSEQGSGDDITLSLLFRIKE